ncbi:hypothetical protein P171DRAFT_494611 [Karstenula rhodostoma CBS 690.94]|uniref:Uncharacterized protein n=1 Tax=Karstenula rhodostoma CBS 690.94 TaxID=1392251 RepID=A0A9P4UBK5_9PLEO|nr:hypothetical protein P171DRAFT_494611 [Karstenula rhodostoma CBS 690.94]
MPTYNSSIRNFRLVRFLTRKCTSIRQRYLGRLAILWLSFLRSVGLKLLVFSSEGEKQKEVVSDSRWIAFTRAGVHILPITFSALLIGLNDGELLNGPMMNTFMTLVLQVLAKLHELTIVGSLTAIALDTVRCHLLDQGLSIGLLSSGLSIGTPSWLWTKDTFGGFGVFPVLRDNWRTFNRIPAWFRENFRLRTAVGARSRSTLSLQLRLMSLPRLMLTSFPRSKRLLCGMLVMFTLLATVAGPGSAVLLIPAQQWVASASTDFYLRGTTDMLWPNVLSSNHTGVGRCVTTPLHTEFDSCLIGGWKTLVAVFEHINPIIPGWDISMPAVRAYQVPPARLIQGGYSNAADPDTWAKSPHMAVISHADYLSHQAELAFQKAKGRSRRLRDFGSANDLHIVTEGKFPVARVACSNLTELHGPETLIDFPVLTEKVYWRPNGDQKFGPSRPLAASDLGFSHWDALSLNATTVDQARARWVPMPEDLGSGSAVLLYLTQNHTHTYARGCVAEAWWANGQAIHVPSPRWAASWIAWPGLDSHRDTANSELPWLSLFEPRLLPYYERIIKVDQAWLDALTPMMPEASQAGNNLLMTSFEALLNQTRLNRPWELPGDWERFGLDLE